VVREAIARLASEGLVWSQQGRGAFVSESTKSTVLKIDYDTIQHGDAFRSLFELRGALEVSASDLAANRRTVQDLNAMRQALMTMTAAPYGSVAWLDADLDFPPRHRRGNPQRLSRAVHRLRSPSGCARASWPPATSTRPRTWRWSTLNEHELILAAIEAQDGAAAQQAMQDHLNGAAQRVGLPEGEAAPPQHRPRPGARRRTGAAA